MGHIVKRLKAVQKKNILSVCLIIFAFVFVCSGCGKTVKKATSYQEPSIFNTVGTNCIARNSHFQLDWDEEKKCILLRNNTTGNIWSSIPYDFYSSDEEPNVNLNSPINISYVDSEDMGVYNLRGYVNSVKKGTVSSKKIDNGIEVSYYFKEIEAIIPVSYTLRDDSLQISIDPKKIVEGVNKLYQVSIAPFMCAVKNNTDNSYLFVPSGSGALMYTDECGEDARTFEGEVYGCDAARKIIESPTNEESIRLPVFGIKTGNTAMCAIIEEGAESALIDAESGNIKTGYTNVYATFNIRGYDKIESRLTGGLVDVDIFADDMSTSSNFTVGYYPLENEDANYVGMAKTYSNYLNSKGKIKSSSEENMLSLKILGGIETKDFLLGIPYMPLQNMTSFSDAKSIIDDVISNTNYKPVVNMVGFGESGISPGKIAGGYNFSDLLGSNADRLALEDYCKSNGIEMYTDFDLVNIRKSGNGFSSVFDTAKTANLQKSTQYYLSKSIRGIDKKQVTYALLKRSCIIEAADKLLSAVKKKNVSAISFNSLSSICYSDYNNSRSYSKGNMDNDVTDIINNFRANGYKVVASSANAYAAAAADRILEAPIQSSKNYCFDAEIPFYEIVFKGYVPINATAINTSTNAQQQILKSVESGAGLSFTLIKNYDILLLDPPESVLNVSVYEDNKTLIADAINECKEYYSAIKDAKIKNHQILQKDVTKTTFDNGVSVYVNKSKETVATQIGEVSAESFKYVREGD